MHPKIDMRILVAKMEVEYRAASGRNQFVIPAVFDLQNIRPAIIAVQ